MSSRAGTGTRGKGRPRKITLDVILSSTSLTRSSTESTESYLQRVTHLHLQAKRIQKIETLDQCTNLKVASALKILRLVDIYYLFLILYLCVGIVFIRQSN